MKRVVTAFRSATNEVRLENILIIMENEATWEDYDLVHAINHWLNNKDRRRTEEKGPRKYKKRQSKKNIFWNLSDSKRK